MHGFLLVPGAMLSWGELVFIKIFAKVGWEHRKVFSTVLCSSFAEYMYVILIKVLAELPLFTCLRYLRYLPD